MAYGERYSRKILRTTILFGLAGAAVLVGTRRLPNAGNAKAVAPPAAMPVPVMQAAKQTIPLYLDFPARTEALQNLNLQAKVSGYLQSQAARDGADVKAGDLLYKIDPRDYQAALDQAQAQEQRDEAGLNYARGNYNRGHKLMQSGFLAKDPYDQRMSALNQAEATLGMDKAAVEAAQLNLGYTNIRAPFAGRLGRSLTPVGTLVSVGGATLNTLVQLDPIYITFNPSETDISAIEKARRAGGVRADIVVPGEEDLHHEGNLAFLNNVVDQTTGTITARLLMDNHDFAFLPGQYVRVRLHIGKMPDAMMVPQAAIGSSQLGKYVYVVGKDDVVEQRMVSLGPAEGGMVAIKTGIAQGDRIVDGDLQKISRGMAVRPMPPTAK